MKPGIFCVIICLLAIVSPTSAFGTQWWVGGSVGAGISLLGGEDFRTDLELVDGRLEPGYSFQASPHVRYEVTSAFSVRVRVPVVSRFGGNYTFSEEFDGEPRDYDGSLRWWTVGSGFDLAFYPGNGHTRPIFAAGLAGMFPAGSFLQEERSTGQDDGGGVEVIRRIDADRLVSLHATAEAGIQRRMNALSGILGIRYEIPLTGYFSEAGWPDLKGHGVTLNIALERRL